VNYSYSLPVVGSASGNLGRATGAAYATAEFPKPTYVKGRVDGDFAIAGYSIGFHKEFESGSQCGGSELGPDPSVTPYQQQNVKDSLSYSLIKNIVTPGTSNVSRVTDFAVVLNYPYNEAFELEEQQASGQINTRTFRVTYTASLKQDSLPAGNGPVLLQGTAPKLVVPGGTANTPPPPPTNVVSISAGAVDLVGAKKFLLSKVQFKVVPLKANTSYHFRISGKLEEKVGNNWVPVKKKGTNAAITQTESLWFKTNSDAVNTNAQVQVAPAGIKKVI
jgi:hypothetical protein